MGDLTNLPNIRKELAVRLHSIGINDLETLQKIGSIKAVMLMTDALGKGCHSTLYALEGALEGVRWHQLLRQVRQQLKSELDKHYVEKSTNREQ